MFTNSEMFQACFKSIALSEFVWSRKGRPFRFEFCGTSHGAGTQALAAREQTGLAVDEWHGKANKDSQRGKGRSVRSDLVSSYGVFVQYYMVRRKERVYFSQYRIGGIVFLMAGRWWSLCCMSVMDGCMDEF